MTTIATTLKDTFNIVSDAPQHSLWQSVGLHLLPGIASLFGFIIAAAIVTGLGLPLMFALYLSILLVEAPVLSGLLIYLSKQENGAFSWQALFPYRERLPFWPFLGWGVPILIWSISRSKF